MCPSIGFKSGFAGGLAEYMILSAANLESVPKQVAMATATAWLCSFTTAWRTLITGSGPRPSETALIIDASGGIGHAGL
jgi:NADPH:quinone reductase and related Zn-dependent oxidoreductases